MAQLLSSLPLGAKVKFGKYSLSGATQPITWIIVAKDHVSTPAYPTNSVTLLTEKIIDSLATDAIEPNNPISNIAEQGNSEYRLSNIDQWLNKDNSAGNWYSATHSYDQSPTNNHVERGRGYADRAGFLNAFSTHEKNAIMNTTIRCAVGETTNIYDISRKVFLPSDIEVGISTINSREGNTWEYFNVPDTSDNLSYWVCTMTQQLYDDTTLDWRPASVTTGYQWRLRTPVGNNTAKMIQGNGVRGGTAARSHSGLRPAINLPRSTKVSDTTDSDGCYTFVWNTEPPTPTTINAPVTVYGGKSNSISWSKVTDPDGDVVTYQLECSLDGGAYTQIYSGTALSYAHLVPFGTSFVTYRVKAVDPSGESSAYVTSDTKTVVNNNAPVISGSDANLGVKSSGFTGTYTVTDANNNTVTVTEAIDGVRIRSLVATLGQSITYGVTENTWLALPNGSHTLTISATDGIDTSVRTYVFTKLVDTLKIQNTTPWSSGGVRPSRIMIVVTRNIPAAATFKVEVCNNGYDASPTWEDATDAVANGLVHVFSNKNKTAANWGVLVRVTVARNGAIGACYVSAIGGNFE